MDRWKSTASKKLRHGESQKGEDKRWRRWEREKVRREKMQVRAKVGKSRNTVFFQNTPCSEHFWKLRCGKSARRCGAKHIWKWKALKHVKFGALLEVEMSKKCTPLWREAHFQAKMHKAHHVGTTFGSWDVENMYAVVARSTFGSENVQNTPASDH